MRLLHKVNDRRLEAVFCRISLDTLVTESDVPASEQIGKMEREEVDLIMPEKSRVALISVLLWARLNGIDFDRIALDELVSELRKQRQTFPDKASDVIWGGRSKGTKNRSTLVLQAEYQTLMKKPGMTAERARQIVTNTRHADLMAAWEQDSTSKRKPRTKATRRAVDRAIDLLDE